MNFSDPYLLFSSLLIGLVGLGFFIYGKKAQEPKTLGIGIILCVFPMFTHSLALMWAIAGVCLAGAWFLPRMD